MLSSEKIHAEHLTGKEKDSPKVQDCRRSVLNVKFGPVIRHSIEKDIDPR